MKLLWFSMLFAAGMACAADMYRWIDENGVVNYTPYPPPANIKNVEQKKLGGNTIQTSGASYSMQQAMKNFPVTLYTTADCGAPCSSAQAYLKKRGIPYTEKNPQDPNEIANFKKLAGSGMQVPVLIVGNLKMLKGYLESEWSAVFDAAGYPDNASGSAVPPAQ